MLLATPLAKLPQKRNRIVVCVFMLVFTAVSVIPFLAPAFNRSYLASLKTRLDSEGICRQSNDYTCGPAAAVTAESKSTRMTTKIRRSDLMIGRDRTA